MSIVSFHALSPTLEKLKELGFEDNQIAKLTKGYNRHGSNQNCSAPITFGQLFVEWRDFCVSKVLITIIFKVPQSYIKARRIAIVNLKIF